MIHICPHCLRPLDPAMIRKWGARMASAMATGACQRRTPEQARAAAEARWKKYRERKPRGRPKSK